MTTEIVNITLEINGVETEATVKVYFEAGQEAITNRDPNECQEGSDDSLELSELVMTFIIDNRPIPKFRDVSVLLEIPDIYVTVLDQVKDHIEEDNLSRQEPDAP